MRLVLDTNVVASALLWHGPPRQLLGLAQNEDVSLFSSLPLLAELTGILSRSEFEKKIAASLLSVDQLVDLYAGVVSLVRPIPTPRLAPDPCGHRHSACGQGGFPGHRGSSFACGSGIPRRTSCFCQRGFARRWLLLRRNQSARFAPKVTAWRTKECAIPRRRQRNTWPAMRRWG